MTDEEEELAQLKIMAGVYGSAPELFYGMTLASRVAAARRLVEKGLASRKRRLGGFRLTSEGMDMLVVAEGMDS